MLHHSAVNMANVTLRPNPLTEEAHSSIGVSGEAMGIVFNRHEWRGLEPSQGTYSLTECFRSWPGIAKGLCGCIRSQATMGPYGSSSPILTAAMTLGQIETRRSGVIGGNLSPDLVRLSTSHSFNFCAPYVT